MTRALVLIWLTAACLTARAAPARLRVVLADPDLELRHAVSQALAPWQLELVVDAGAAHVAGADDAERRASAAGARFVVWRAGGELVVYDRESRAIERRASRAGAFDPVTAASAALTIKTMMRLPAPPPPVPEAPPVPDAAPPAPPRSTADAPGLRVEAGPALRIAFGDDTAVVPRVAGAVLLRPWAAGWRFGAGAEVGGGIDVNRASFKGTWSDSAAHVIAAWTHAAGRWELEPRVALGLRWSSLDGTEMNTPRSESSIAVAAGLGVAGRLRLGDWTLGARVELDRAFHTPTYTKADTPAEVFQVPATGLMLGATLSWDPWGAWPQESGDLSRDGSH